MDNNDILRRIRYTFDFNDDAMMRLFSFGGIEATRAEISDWLKKEDDDAFVEMNDRSLAAFLNGVIVDRRGKKEGLPMVPEKVLNNNIVLRKLKIALDLKSEEMLALFESVEKPIGPHELSAFLRNPKQGQYRECNDQYLRNFLNGIQKKYRK